MKLDKKDVRYVQRFFKLLIFDVHVVVPVLEQNQETKNIRGTDLFD